MILRKKVLVVEDNELNRALLSEILSCQYQVLEAENGQVALDIVKQNKDSISLILLDVRMPVMDGYTFLDQIKSEEDLALIPVIVMTQSDSDDDEVSALAHGATDFVPKPYRPQVILHRVASIIKLRETAAMVNQFQYDRLTGLYSKEFFYQKVRECLNENPEKEYTIVCSNIENFKLYNDTFGTKAGDSLLKEVASKLRGMMGENGICGRYSADRFLCLQERQQETKDRMQFFKEEQLKSDVHNKNIVTKWGVYEIIDSSLSVEQMCDRALLAVDSIKGQYNQPYAIYDDALRSKLLREQAITEAMETALSENQFIVYFQPKYSLDEECMVGAEALVRWIHPEWGFISPGEFIPLFEKNGFIPHLDQYIWEQVCRRLLEWKNKGYNLLPVSVNVSRSDIYQINLADTLMNLTQKYGIDPEYLHLEITESAYAENPEQIIHTVDALRKQGFMIEMDDFGSGYSSLNMLNQMKMDILKLDMKFIQNEMAKPVNQSILSYVISMSHGIGLRVVAEGVETREQMERLHQLGCDYVQGYYFAKPMPAAEYEELLKVQPLQRAVETMKIMRREQNVNHILIVDEDERYRARVQETFGERYHVMEASDLESALVRITNQESEVISAVILSMTIPENGAAILLKTLRQNPAYWRIPVLATIPGGQGMNKYPLAMQTDDFLCKYHPQFDLLRRIERLVGITASHEREMILQDEASWDYVTGLLNRRGLQAALESLKKEDLPLTVCLFELDVAENINDTGDHDAGDRLIQSFADLLRMHTRSKDIVCRYSGDKFLVFLKHLGDENVAVRKSLAVCQSFESSCSVGIAMCSSNEKNIIRMVDCANQALCRAKRDNKGSYCLWNEAEGFKMNE